jgi:hypothetical protein
MPSAAGEIISAFELLLLLHLSHVKITYSIVTIATLPFMRIHALPLRVFQHDILVRVTSVMVPEGPGGSRTPS